MNISVSVRPFTFTKDDGEKITYYRICINNLPVKPIYEKDKSAYRMLLDIIKQGKEEY